MRKLFDSIHVLRDAGADRETIQTALNKASSLVEATAERQITWYAARTAVLDMQIREALDRNGSPLARVWLATEPVWMRYLVERARYESRLLLSRVLS